MVRTFLCQPLADSKVFSDEYEPKCGCCTKNGLVLIASGCTNEVYVYSAYGRSGGRNLFKFQSIGAVRKLSHCSFGNYIISLERKWQDIRGGSNPRAAFQYARVYVNWMKSQVEEKYPMQQRNGYTKEPLSLSNPAGQFLAIDIPVKYSVNDMSCCDINGNIALSTEAKIYLYVCIEANLTENTEAVMVDFECRLEIDSGFQINSIALFGYYIAFASSYEIRVIQVMFDRKESVTQAEDITKLLEEDEMLHSMAARDMTTHCSQCQSVPSEKFVLWNINQGCQQGSENLEHETIAVQSRRATSSSVSTPTYMINSSCVKFDAVAQDATYVNLDNTAKEVIGPKESISGHPLIVINSFHELGYVIVNHVTMLYRRFLSEQTDMTLNGGSIHSIQWLPLYADERTLNMMAPSESPTPSESMPTVEGSNKVLVSLGLFFSMGRKGYLYELFSAPRLLTEYDFTETCISACLTRSFLHVITKNGLETYTTRLYSSASLAAKSYHGEDDVEFIRQSNERQRGRSTQSCLSASEYENRSQLYEPKVQSSENETFEVDLTPEESHFTEVFRESKATSLQSKTRLSLSSRKKRASDKRDRESPGNDSDCSMGDRPGSCLTLANRPTDALYAFPDLVQPCPPCGTEVCLIGIYPLRGFIFIGSTENHIIILQKTFEFKGKRGSIPKERMMPWNVYVREIAPAIDVYRNIINLIEGSEFANPHVFHQLLSEAHMILRTDLTSNTPEDKRENIKASIKRSAVNLGDFFARCKVGFDYFLAKEYYNMSGIKLEQVLLRHAKRDSEEDLGMRYGVGIIEFLNGHLLADVDKPIQLAEDSVLHILKIYSVAAPEVLSKLVLKSRLHKIPADKALQIFEQFEETESNSSSYKQTTLDYIAMTVLHMRDCDPNHAEHTLRKIPNEQLTAAFVHYPELVLNGSNLTHLGQLLRKHFRTVFTSLLVLLFDNGTINLDAAVNACRHNRENSEQSTKPNYKLLDLLESLLDDEKRKEHYPEVMSCLLKQYFTAIEFKASVVLLKIPHQHLPKGNGHFASRFDWLDKLSPFSGDSPAPQDCLLRKQMQPSMSRKMSPEASPPSASMSNQQFDCDQMCSCCCCNRFLLKIQSLLCSQYCSESTYQNVLNFVEKSDCIFKDSIKLLCYPALGKVSEAVNFVIMDHPSIMLDYAKTIFKNKQNEWEIFLQFLLKTLREELYERWNRDTYLDALKGTLAMLVRICKPYDFIKLLPKDGTARFFLPFIQDCHQIHSSVKMRVDLVKRSDPVTF